MKEKSGWLYFVPGFVVMVSLGLFPFLFNIFISLHRWTGGGLDIFIGLKNYINIFSNTDFYQACSLTAFYLLSILVFEFVLGLLIAFFLDSHFFGKNFLRTVILLTMVMSPVVAGLIWRWIFNAEWGLANAILNYLNKESIAWLTTPRLALLSVIIADIWQWTPFVALVVLSGLEAIPIQLRQASLVDGANWLQHQMFIALPALKPVIWVAILFRFIDGIRYVDKIFVMTYGGPGKATTVLGFYTYLRAFKYWRLGLAASLGIILLFSTIFIANIIVKKSNLLGVPK